MALLVACSAPPTSDPPTHHSSPKVTPKIKEPSLFTVCMENPEILSEELVTKYRPTYGSNVYIALCWAITHHGRIPPPEAFG